VTVVVDASVAAKWVLDEQGSDRANTLRSESDLIAPTLIVAELGNALWKATVLLGFSQTDALSAIRMVLVPFNRIIPLEQLRQRALELAIELKHPIYDCFYLALAERERAPLITTDKRLLGLRRKMKGAEIVSL
jgi:predicted nucleic acid-binding protein